MFFWHLQRKGIPFSSLVFKYGGYPSSIDPDHLAEVVNQGQSVYFFTLVRCLPVLRSSTSLLTARPKLNYLSPANIYSTLSSLRDIVDYHANRW